MPLPSPSHQTLKSRPELFVSLAGTMPPAFQHSLPQHLHPLASDTFRTCFNISLKSNWQKDNQYTHQEYTPENTQVECEEGTEEAEVRDCRELEPTGQRC